MAELTYGDPSGYETSFDPLDTALTCEPKEQGYQPRSIGQSTHMDPPGALKAATKHWAQCIHGSPKKKKSSHGPFGGVHACETKE